MGLLDVHCPLSIALSAEWTSGSSWNLSLVLSLFLSPFAPALSAWMDLVHHLAGSVSGSYYQHLAHPAVTRPCGTIPCQGQHCLLWSHPLLLEHLVWGNSRLLLLPGRGNRETTLTPSTLKTFRHLPSSAICPHKKWSWKDFDTRLIFKDT